MDTQAVTTTPIQGGPKRVEYFEVLRVVATIAVIGIHAAITEWHAIPMRDIRWVELTWINGALRFCVPIFFMISGALFLDPRRTLRARSLRRRIARLTVGYAVWSLLYAALTVYGPGGSRDLWEFVSEFVTGHFHLWFLIALIGLNLATPILRRITTDRRISWYFVALAVPFAAVFPLLEPIPGAGDLLRSVLGTMRFDLVLGYSGYFVLGYLLHTARGTTRARVGWIICAAAGIAATVWGTIEASRAAGETDERYFDFVSITVAVVAVAVFVCARDWNVSHRLSTGWSRAVTVFAGASFGIYLVHPFFLWCLRQAGVTTEIASPWISVPVLTIAVAALSLGAALLLRCIPWVRGVLA